MTRSTLKPGTKPMKRSPLARGATKMRARRLGKAKRKNAYLADMCHGQACYLLIPGICINDPAAVVPAHSNQSRDGKGGALKANDEKTCPGCFCCHYEIDQGNKFTRAEKFEFWDAGYARWTPVRGRLLKVTK